MIKKPTCTQIWEEELDEIKCEIVGTWRWGTIGRYIFHRKEDNTYWSVRYQVGNDGETNGLREGIAEIDQVVKEEKTITIYAKLDESN